MGRYEETNIGNPTTTAGGTQQKEGNGDAATAAQPAETATPTVPSWMDKLGMELNAAQAEEEGARNAYEESQARVLRQQEAVKKATKEGTSLWASLLEKNKPEYDKKKENRMRWRATIQALGDILSATAKGAIAYSKEGMGYVPQSTDGAYFKTLEEMNRLQKEYQKRAEEWRNLELQHKGKAIESKEAAEKALLKAYDDDAKDAARRYEAARKATQAAYSDLIKARIRADERAEDFAWREADREDRQENTRAIKALGGGGASRNNTLTKRGYIHKLFTDLETNEAVIETPEMEEYDTGERNSKGEIIWGEREVVKRRKTISPKTQTISEHNAIGEYDARIDKALKYEKEGMSLEDAVAKVFAENKK